MSQGSDKARACIPIERWLTHQNHWQLPHLSPAGTFSRLISCAECAGIPLKSRVEAIRIMCHMLNGRAAVRPKTWKERYFIPVPSVVSEYATASDLLKPPEADEDVASANAWRYHETMSRRHNMGLMWTSGKGLVVRDEFDQMLAGVPCWVDILSEAAHIFADQVGYLTCCLQPDALNVYVHVCERTGTHENLRRRKS